MYGSDRKYIYMKMKTLVNGCGYKRRTKSMLEELEGKLLKLELYIKDSDKNPVKFSDDNYKMIKNVKMDQFIMIYNY